MLEMKSACERCGAETPPDAEAMICSYECTWCATCAVELGRCPNCNGVLEQRPTRA